MQNKNIKLEKIKKSFHGKKILDIKYMEFEKGEVTYLLGVNGAGKSTLLNILSGVTSDYTGKITNNFMTSEISLIDANPYMLKKSVYKNISYPLEIRKIDKIDEKVKKLLKIFDIEKFKDIAASKLSSGETQKVAIVRGLASKPKLLLLDEPTSNLDKEAKLELIEIIKKYKNKNNTIIIVTHDENIFKNLPGKKVTIEKIRS
ncbi:MAG: ABC transporter ATP-binding protein [Psychrilyobacter sp.]|nr:ABC transporter ATP-binding protein [Psychrilyobacter sp.]